MGSRRGMRYAVMWVGLVIGLGAIAGCDGGGEAEPTASAAVTTAAAPSASPTPTELVTAVPMPVMPPEMANNDAAGAEAAVRYFFELYGYTYVNRDLGAWNEMSAPGCVFCESVTAEVEAMIASGESQRGGKAEVRGIRANTHNPALDVHLVELEVVQLPYEGVAADGSVVQTSAGGDFELSIMVQLGASGWTVLEAGSTDE